MKTGIELIATKRKEQIEKHGRSILSDVQNNPNRELQIAASTLISDIPEIGMPINWSDAACYKMVNKPIRERLIISGALIAAELDRLNALKE